MAGGFLGIARRRRVFAAAVFAASLISVISSVRAESPAAETQVVVQVKADSPANYTIPRFISGKFAEHLGSNIYNGMSAQILRNPTFADFPFVDGTQTPDGRPRFLSDEGAIATQIRSQAARLRWPDSQILELLESRQDALAHWWVRVGPQHSVCTSPDTGPYGGRAQRVEVDAAGQGIAQWTYLPLHRVRRYDFQCVIRSPKLSSVTISLMPEGRERPIVESELTGVSVKWSTLRSHLDLPADAPANAMYRVALTTSASGQFVIERALLTPADSVNGADPDVVRLLKESHLPVLRWPGGNFASAYHWHEGVGPAQQRPTRPNWAWGGVEPNLFGTDEFIDFCRAVGAEPMICVNAGDGTPEEAAQWIEYCNGPTTSPLGAERAANGHPLPYNVRLWEVGNELWGHWQVSWTTPAGYADRYRQFSATMLKADPQIKLYACGEPVLRGRKWNEALIQDGGTNFQRITDHPLIGGNLPGNTDPLEVYRNFMAAPDVLGARWAELCEAMRGAGIAEPRLAITELQLFAHLTGRRGGRGGGGVSRLNRENLVNPGTQAEAVYDTLIYHTAVRLGTFVDMVTHSAVVNHGGGLRKEFERVYANPCYYAQSAFAAFQGTKPVAVNVEAPFEHTPTILPDLAGIAGDLNYSVVSAIAARAENGSLLISLVDRASSPSLHLNIELTGILPQPRAEIWSLSAEVPWAANTFDKPEAVKPRITTASISAQTLSLELKPYTVLRIRIIPAN